MIQIFMESWHKNKGNLENELKKYNEPFTINITYLELVKLVIKHIINPAFKTEDDMLSIDDITVINDGEYQGTQLFIVPTTKYQPTINDYYIVDNYYGSCSGCDLLLEIIEGKSELDQDDIDNLMNLCLNLTEKFKKLTSATTTSIDNTNN